ncbi:MAG: hypothetical protein ACJ768_02525 [Gaiellaceae bacterium]
MTLRSLPPVRTLALAAVLATGAFLGLAATALASASQYSSFQDDRLFVNSGSAVQAQALDTVASLGPHTIHSVVNWRNLAPSPDSTHKPSFNDSSPAGYAPGKWAIYDSLVRGAVLRGLRVHFSPAGPAPQWALKCSKTELRKYGKTKGTCKPDPKLYANFVKAIGTRYNGSYQAEDGSGVLPRVSIWSIWNEPDLPSWLSPAIEKKGRTRTDVGAMVYRNLAYAALGGFKASGHTVPKDTILLGETAPIGLSGLNASPSEFYHGVFCQDTRGHKLRGKAAKALGCKGKLKGMAVSGIAHHPYTRGAFSNLLARQKSGNATIAYIPRLLRILKDGVRAHVLSRSAASSLYWTEFGVASSPPSSSGKGVSLATQAEWINQFQFISYLSKNVKEIVQFQLDDDAGLVTSAKTTFQTGLRFASTAQKPAFGAYRVPLYVVDNGSSLTVWGGVHAFNIGGQQVQLLNGGNVVKTITLGNNGYFLTKLPKRGGTWQLKWTRSDGTVFTSRTAKAVKKKKAIASRH